MKLAFRWNYENNCLRAFSRFHDGGVPFECRIKQEGRFWVLSGTLILVPEKFRFSTLYMAIKAANRLIMD